MIRKSGLSRTRAFSLIEALLGMVVIAFAIVSMLTVIPFGFTQAQNNSLDVQAVAVGQQMVDNERNALTHGQAVPSTATTVAIDGGDSYYNNGQTATTGYGNFTVTPDGCSSKIIDGSAAGGTGVSLWQCSATVTWTEQGSQKSVKVQANVVE